MRQTDTISDGRISMSLKFVSDARTVCEVLREINDELQGLPVHAKVLPKLREAEGMCKRMAKKLVSYNKNFDAGWWKANPDKAAKIERRLNQKYIT